MLKDERLTPLCAGTYNFSNARSYYPRNFGSSAIVCSGNLHAQQPQQPPAPPAPLRPSLPQRGQSIRQNVNLVDVLFTVLNRQNKIVADLNRDNFRVFDDDAEQEIRFFNRQTDMPLRVGLLLDTSNSIRDRLKFEQQAAIDFLYDVVRKDKDRAFLMTVDDQPEMVQKFTGDLDNAAGGHPEAARRRRDSALRCDL